MKVLVLNHNTPKGVLGVYEYNLCKSLSRRGLQVDDITIFGDNSHYGFCRSAVQLSRPGAFLPRRVSELFSGGILRMIRRGEYDIIHLNGAFWSFLPLQVSVLNRLVNQGKGRLVMTSHAFEPTFMRSFVNSMRELVYTRQPLHLLSGVRCLAYGLMDGVICLSEAERQHTLREFGLDPARVFTIPNAVDLERFERGGYDFKKKHDVTSEFVILYVGQIIKMKGIEYLLEALRFLIQWGHRCLLYIISYNRRVDLLSIAKDLGVDQYLHVLDNLPERDLISAYKSCDIFVLPSLTEGLPTVLLEAMAAGKPVVATSVAGVPELISNGSNGLLIRPRDSIGLAKNIQMLLESDEMRRKMGIKGRSTVRRKFSWEIVGEQIVTMYESLIDDSRTLS